MPTIGEHIKVIIRDNNLTALLGIILFPLFLSLAPSVYGAVNVLAALLLLVGLMGGWQHLKALSGSVRYVWLAFGLYVIGALLSLINNDNWDLAAWRFERYYPFLLVIPLFGIFYQAHRYILYTLLAGVVVGSIGMAAACFNELYILNEARAGDSTGINENTLAHLAYVYAAISLAAIITLRLARRWKALLLCGMMAAVFAGIATGSRGALLAFFVMLFVLVILKINTKSISRKIKLSVLFGSGFLILLIITYINYNAFWSGHLEKVGVQVGAFFSGDYTRSSIGVRLLMWMAAWKIFLAHPLIGTGIGDQRDDLVALQLVGDIPNMGPAAYSTFHNFYFDALAMTGLFGFCAMLLALFIVPGWLFWQAWLVTRHHEVQENFYPLAGILILVVSAFYGLTASWLYLRGLPIILIIMVVLLTGCDRILVTKKPS